MVLFVFLVCLLNVGLWIVFLTKFKNLFSVKNVLKDGREELNRMIIDLNNNADRDITLVNDRIKKLRMLIAEADKQIKLMESIEAKNTALVQFKNDVATATKKTSMAASKVVDSYNRTKGSSIKPETQVKVTPYGLSEADIEGQTTLFDLSDDDSKPAKTKINVNSDGSSYAQIPVVTPKVYVPETPVPLREGDMKSKIVTMFDAGLSADDIATRLSCSTTEVQFVLALENRV